MAAALPFLVGALAGTLHAQDRAKEWRATCSRSAVLARRIAGRNRRERPRASAG
ncbi:MAG TPA: hypothetical protein VGA42_01500 [Gemmatimonadales bacterium]